MTKILLVSGSRHWSDPAPVIDALSAVLRDWYPAGRPAPEDAPTMRHGTAKGLDTIAARIWESWGLPLDPHPAVWAMCGDDCPVDGGKHRRDSKWHPGETECPRAGHRRNRLMCDLEPRPDLVVGFRIATLPCHGTRGCIGYAETVGLPVRWILG